MKNWQKIKTDKLLLHKMLTREKVNDAIRVFFKKKGFHEVETPLMVKCPGTEPYLEVFETKLNLADGKTTQAFLLTSPEYAMKKLLAGQMGSIFQICKSFRNNEGLSSRHNSEFSILEWYHTEADYNDVMDDFEQMMLFILNFGVKNDKDSKNNRNVKNDDGENVKKIFQKTKLNYQGKEYDLSTPYPRISVAEAFEKYVGVSKDELLSRDSLVVVAKEKGYQLEDDVTWEEVYNQLFLNEIETKLAEMNTPVFIYDYPSSQAALSKKKEDDPRFAERFEVYMAGLELGNAFSELTDGAEQEERFREELKQRDELGKTKYELDIDLIDALKSGMPRTGGIAVGVDRLVMLFADAESIEDVMFFPASEVFSFE